MLAASVVAAVGMALSDQASTEDNAAMAEWNPCYRVRGGLDHCRITFTQKKQGRVAYLGGSITTMPGWRDLTYDLLKARFPETEFEFIDAGIGGTDSTLGAFRLEHDVFKNGPVDLLFLEYAVNDSGEGRNQPGRMRAMEGIIRQARRLHPRIDIIVQYFADQGKVAALNAGHLPDVIHDHEIVVAHYNLPALNLAVETTRRLNAGAFTWEDFSRDSCHPLPLGHALYAECIGTFLDAAWSAPLDAEAATKEYALPTPLDPLNYENGRFLPVEDATVVSAWTHDAAWMAEKTCNYSGAVDVLVAEAPGATLTLPFDGRLIGIYAIAGMDAGQLEASIDGGDFATTDLFDHYCMSFHRPVCHLLRRDLAAGHHVLTLRMGQGRNEKSEGHAARILEFVAN